MNNKKIPLFTWLGKLITVEFGVVIVAAAAIFAAKATTTSRITELFMPEIKQVLLTGNFTHLDRIAIEFILKDVFKQNFFSVEIDNLAAEVKKLPWMRTVLIQRLWPQSLIIAIQERKPTAYWNDQHLLDENADSFLVFPMDDFTLPRLYGGESRQTEVLSIFSQLSSISGTIGRRITWLKENSRHSIALHLDNGVRINLGRRHAAHRLTRFVTAYRNGMENIFNRSHCVDMRYPSGFSVKLEKFLPKIKELC